MRFSTKLTLSLTLITATATAASSFFLLNAYRTDTIRNHLTSERQLALHSAARIEELLRLSRTIATDRIAQTPEIVLAQEQPCSVLESTATRVSEAHQQTLNTLGLRTEAWTRLIDRTALCTGAQAPESTRLSWLPAGPLLPFPTLGIFTRDTGTRDPGTQDPGSEMPSERLTVLALPDLRSPGASLSFITDAEGKLLWSSDTPEFIERAMADTQVTPELIREWATRTVASRQASAFEHLPTGIVAAAPIRTAAGASAAAGRDPTATGVFFTLSYRPTALYPVQLQLLRSIPLLIGILALCLLAGRLFGAALTRPLTSLIQKSERISSGDFDSPFENSTGDEFGLVQQAFNQMMGKIRELVKATRDTAIMENELKLANQVQQMLIPPKDLRISRFQIASHFETATYCGGDLWGYLEVPRPSGSPLLLLFIGDVEGHGAAPALVTAGVRGAIAMLESWLKTHPELATQPGRINESLNQAVYACTKGSMLMTFCTVALDPDANKIRFSNAGHCRPYVLRRDPGTGKYVPSVVSSPGTPFGEAQATRYDDTVEEDFANDSILVVYSDGLIEAQGKGDTKFQRKDLARLLRQLPTDGARRFLDQLISTRHETLNQAPIPDDDVTVVVCRLPGGAGAGTRTAIERPTGTRA
jgi:serine phosphatase RsbU (regulator of sigma subunit)